MKNIKAEEIIDLLFLPLTDDRVVETLDDLGIEQPSLDEEYEMEGRIWTEGEEESGFAILFEAPDTNSELSDPVATQIDFYEEYEVQFPLGLHKNDDYETVIEKTGKKPDFCDKDMAWSKQWVFSFDDNEIVYAIHFKPDMKSINTIVVAEFERDGIEEDEFIFPCEELEA